MTAWPDVSERVRNSTDDFVFVACDGIWDVMSNQEVVDFVRHRLSIHKDLTKLSGEILETSLAKV